MSETRKNGLVPPKDLLFFRDQFGRFWTYDGTSEPKLMAERKAKVQA